MARASFWVVLLTGLLMVGGLLLFRYLRAPLLGEALAALVLLYAVLLVVCAWLGSQHALTDAAFFLIPLGLLLVMVDAFAVQELRTLSFPHRGGPRFGPVPGYIAGLWIAPLLVVVWLAETLRKAAGWIALPVAILAAAGVFAVVEWSSVALGLWLPRNVWTWQGVAPYAVAAKTLLAVSAWLMFVQVEERVLLLKVAGAAAVAAFYAGALVGCKYLVARIL